MSPQLQPDQLAEQLLRSEDFFKRSTRVLEEADSEFRPNPDSMTVAQQVAHVAHTLNWFVDGVTRPEGFDLDFAKQAQALASVRSLAAARAELQAAYARGVAFLRSQSAEDLSRALPPGPIMGTEPIGNVVWGMVEHTAHHRGALTVYSRLLGKVPVMPYFG